MGGWIEDESWIGDPSNILGNTPVFGGTCIFRGRAGPGTSNFEHVAKYPAHIKHLQVNSVNLAHVSVDLATTITWMRKIWGNMCWYVHKFGQGRYRSPKIATQTFGPKKIRFQKVLLSLKRNFQNPRCFDYYWYLYTCFAATWNTFKFGNLKTPRGWSRRPLCFTSHLKVFVSKDHQITGGTNVDFLKKFMALKNLKTGRLVFQVAILLTLSSHVMAWL